MEFDGPPHVVGVSYRLHGGFQISEHDGRKPRITVMVCEEGGLSLTSHPQTRLFYYVIRDVSLPCCSFVGLHGLQQGKCNKNCNSSLYMVGTKEVFFYSNLVN